MSQTQTFEVVGMTCGHCVSSVSEEVGALVGVREVSVDLRTGRLELTADQPITTQAVREAVEEAGYSLA
jgi:copper ion binding protein